MTPLREVEPQRSDAERLEVETQTDADVVVEHPLADVEDCPGRRGGRQRRTAGNARRAAVDEADDRERAVRIERNPQFRLAEQALGAVEHLRVAAELLIRKRE